MNLYGLLTQQSEEIADLRQRLTPCAGEFLIRYSL